MRGLATRIDRYIVAELVKRLTVALLIVLAALVIERILRLFDFVSMKGGPVDLVWQMAVMLVPHYLGLALPAAFFVSIYLTVARFHNDSEFDAMLASGISPVRFARPLMGFALALAMLSLGVFGYLQPYTRYGYRALYHIVTNIPWDARVPEMAFSRVERDAVVTADRTRDDGSMERVFIQYRDGDADVVVTAAAGTLEFGPMRSYYLLQLENAERIVSRPGQAPELGVFEALAIRRPLAATAPPFRPRGNEVREMTLGELAARPPADAEWTRAQARAELHARLVRSLSVVFLPLLAVPLALSGRRTRTSAGLVVGALVLLIYHYATQTLQGVAALGRVHPGAMWAAMAVLAAISIALFHRAQRRPGANPLDPLTGAIADVRDAARARLARLLPRRARP